MMQHRATFWQRFCGRTSIASTALSFTRVIIACYRPGGVSCDASLAANRFMSKFVALVIGLQIVAVATLGYLTSVLKWHDASCGHALNIVAVQVQVADLVNRRGGNVTPDQVDVKDRGIHPGGRFFSYAAGGYVGHGVGDGCGVVEFSTASDISWERGRMRVGFNRSA